MKINYRINEHVSCEVEGDNQKDMFAEVARFAEVFGVAQCGNPQCKSLNVAPKVRTVDKYTYYEMACSDCGFKLAYGQSQTGNTLFPRKKDPKTDKWLPNGGWAKFVPENKEE